MLKILRRPEVVTGLSSTRIHALEQEGTFPARVRLSDRACGCRSDEVEAWIRARPRATDTRPDIGADPRRRGVGRHRSSKSKGKSS